MKDKKCRVLTPDLKIQAARKAFEAYERAVATAREVMADGPVRGLGTTVFEAQYPEYMGRSGSTGFKCVECGFVQSGRADAQGWKFCPGCGAEIMRFAHDPDRELQEVKLVVSYEQPAHHSEFYLSEKRLRRQKGRAAGSDTGTDTLR